MLYKVEGQEYYVLHNSGEGGDFLEKNKQSQILKGILEGCLLLIISHGEVYGYEVNEKLKRYDFPKLSEGTIYPLLQKMQRAGSISAELRKSSEGPMRKYYSLTAQGEAEKQDFITLWGALSARVTRLIEEDE